MTLVNSLITKGINSTIQLSKGTNLSYQSTGVAVYTSTEIDRWHIGDFISADYIINAEYGQNERETIHATLVATPGNSAVTIFGRTNLNRPILNVRSVATNSYVTLIVEPATVGVQGSIVNFFANYAKSASPIKPISSPATVTQASWASALNAVSATITVQLGSVTGSIITGQRVVHSSLPAFNKVTSWNPLSGQLIVAWETPVNLTGVTNQQLSFSSPLLSTGNVSTEAGASFRSILVPGQSGIDATVGNDYFVFKPGNSIRITTDKTNKELTVSSTAISKISVPDSLPIDTTLSGLSTLNVNPGTGISLDTDTLTNTLTIASNGVSIVAGNGTSISGLSLEIAGGEGIQTQVESGVLKIVNTSTNYFTFKDDSANTSSPDSFKTAFRFRQGAGISATVSQNDFVYGDNLLITNTGVLSIAGKTGEITPTSLISSINDAQTSGIYITPSAASLAMMFFMRAV